MAKVLIVEDDAVIADGMAKHLAAAGFDQAASGQCALTKRVHAVAGAERFGLGTEVERLDDAPLVTRNVKDFSRVPGLRVLSY